MNDEPVMTGRIWHLDNQKKKEPTQELLYSPLISPFIKLTSHYPLMVIFSLYCSLSRVVRTDVSKQEDSADSGALTV